VGAETFSETSVPLRVNTRSVSEDLSLYPHHRADFKSLTSQGIRSARPGLH